MSGRESRGTPIASKIVAVHHHLGLILRLSARQTGIHVEILRPGVVAAELQSSAETTDEFQLQSVVAAVAFGVPEKAGGQVRIGPFSGLNVLNALVDRGAPTGEAAGGVRADLRGDRVG